jgi:selenide,water dikinase
MGTRCRHGAAGLADPQTPGGLLVSCDPASVDAVLALFANEGFGTQR